MYSHMDFRIFLGYKLYHKDNHCSIRTAADNMVDFQCNFPHMNKSDDLVSIDKLRMGHTVMVNMDFLVVVFRLELLESNGTIQMDYQFRLGYNYKLDYD